MKTFLLTMALIPPICGFSQYKQFAIGVFGTSNESFDSHKFYSSPGVSFQFNTNHILSVFTSVSSERIKTFGIEYDDIHGGYTFLNSQLNYVLTPLMLRASFSKKVLLFCELGVAFAWGPKVKVDAIDSETSEQLINPVYFNYSYIPKNFQVITPMWGVGINIPVFRGFRLECNIRKGVFRETSYDAFGDHNYYIFNEKSAFNGVRYSLSLIYQFNPNKSSKYSFTTYYLGIQKNQTQKK